VAEGPHEQDGEAVADLDDHSGEDLADEDVADHQVEPQHYPDVEHAREVLLRKHPEHPVEFVERQLAAPEEIAEPDEVEPDEEVEDEHIQETRLGRRDEALGEVDADG
jgi:hypothetical protein